MPKSPFYIILALLLALASCRPSLPSGIISEGDMEDILYDYHIATNIARQSDEGKKPNQQKMYNDILEKHGYTQAEFDSSMVYYTRHYRLLKDIYDNIDGRLSEKILAMGGNVQDLNSMGEGFSSADTTNVWNDASALLFLQYAPYNVKQFEIKPDTAYRTGDRLLLSFDTEFIVQDGRRDLVAMLAMTLKNDSVVFTTQHFSSPMHASLTVDDSKRLGIKSIAGFLTFVSDPNDSRTTTKLALVRNIKLIRMHTEDPNKPKDEAPTDSLSAPGTSESGATVAGDSVAGSSPENKTINNNGIQKTPLDSAPRPALVPVRRESAILPEKRMLSTKP